MSFFKHLGHAVKHTAEHTAKQVENTGKHVAHTANKSVDVIEDTTNQLEEVVANLSPEHLANEVKHEVLSAINQVKNEAVQAVRTAENEAKTEIQNLAKEAEKEIKNILQAIEGKTAEEVLSFAVDTIKALEPSNIYLQLGPLAVDIGRPIERIDKLQHYAHHPPKTRSEWKQFVLSILPKSIHVLASIGFAFIIESADLELQIQATWEGEDVVNKIDHILDKANIV